ncbi:hypothetical protein K0M31_009152 [Melipona bicolor]|uniref:Uncharacterized protein n=1 Tax=Melipona bicolor TaxID=60889 RepID=A0AA40KJH5_9HYME|nr:hypothetical protein K0M31_009152 [Melipona bicolor]
MAVLDIKFTKTQRERLHRYVVLAISANLLIGFILFFMGMFVSFVITTKLRFDERSLFGLVFGTLTLYGLYVFAHNLMGVKLCYNYFHYAEGPGMNLRLFSWTLLGLFVVLAGCFMASICFSTADLLADQLRQTLLEGELRSLR